MALVAAALVAPLRPRLGALLHSGLFVVALLGDQIRIQPWSISLAILLLSAAWAPAGLAVGRWHLIALWGWAGMHKVLSGGWAGSGAFFIARAAGHPGLRGLVAVLVPATEIALALLGLWPRTWRVLRWAGPIFHLSVVAFFVLNDRDNPAVWPWNLALAAAVPLLFVAGERRRSRAGAVAGAAFLAYPVGFYAGVTDAYVAHNLYSSNNAEASICSGPPPDGLCFPAFISSWTELKVPLPPERRLFVQWFELVCRPPERLRIDGAFTRLDDRRTDFVDCPRT